MRRLVGLLCLGLLASTAPADAKPKKPRPAPALRGDRDAGEPCETHNQCALGLVCLEAKCRTLMWADGAIILTNIARQIAVGSGSDFQRFVINGAVYSDGHTSFVERIIATENVRIESVLNVLRRMDNGTNLSRDAIAYSMATHFPPMYMSQAHHMLFGPGSGMPPPSPDPPSPPSDTPGIPPKRGDPPWHTRRPRTAPPTVGGTGFGRNGLPASAPASETAPEPSPDLPSWPSDTPTAASPPRGPSAPPVAGKAAAGPLDDVDRLADLAELVPDRPPTQTPAPRVYAGIGEYVGAVGPDGLPEGEGRMVYLGGGSYAGSWRAGQWHGAGTLVRPDGQIVRGTFEGGRLVKGETFNRRREN